jgi:hypothetical protein
MGRKHSRNAGEGLCAVCPFFAQNGRSDDDFARSFVILIASWGIFSLFMGIMNTLRGSACHVPML